MHPRITSMISSTEQNSVDSLVRDDLDESFE